jgi:hypothetical protein
LTLTNEYGAVTQARFVDPNRLEVSDGLEGVLEVDTQGVRLRWSNGTVWERPELEGRWSIGGEVTQIAREGVRLTFTNEHGSVAEGILLSPTRVLASGWGNLIGTLERTSQAVRILWDNGTVWERAVLEGSWRIGGGAASVSRDGAQLTFMNEFGVSSEGFFLAPDVVVAVGWGNLVGIVQRTPFGNEIRWMNGTNWTQDQLGMDSQLHAAWGQSNSRSVYSITTIEDVTRIGQFYWAIGVTQGLTGAAISAGITYAVLTTLSLPITAPVLIIGGAIGGILGGILGLFGIRIF